MAIEEVNNNSNKYGLKLNSNINLSSLKIKLSKRTGLPDMDLPALTNTLTINETSERWFSIVLEESMIISIDDKEIKTSISNNELNNSKVGVIDSSKTTIENFNIKNNSDSEGNDIRQVKPQKKGCCSIFGC